jgi:hypothetical protein
MQFTPEEEQQLIQKYFNRYFDGASCIYPLQDDDEDILSETSSPKKDKKKHKFYSNSGYQKIPQGVQNSFDEKMAHLDFDEIFDKRKESKFATIPREYVEPMSVKVQKVKHNFAKNLSKIPENIGESQEELQTTA